MFFFKVGILRSQEKTLVTIVKKCPPCAQFLVAGLLGALTSNINDIYKLKLSSNFPRRPRACFRALNE